MPSQKKIDQVEKLKRKLKEAKSIVLADYQGVSHQQLEELRRVVREAKGDFTVVKNRLFLRALKNSDLGSRIGNVKITGPTAILIAKKDELLPLQRIATFIKETKLLTLKLGFFFGKTLTGDEVTKLSLLPPKDALFGQLTGQLKAPIYTLYTLLRGNMARLVSVLEQIRKSKGI